MSEQKNDNKTQTIRFGIGNKQIIANNTYDNCVVICVEGKDYKTNKLTEKQIDELFDKGLLKRFCEEISDKVVDKLTSDEELACLLKDAVNDAIENKGKSLQDSLDYYAKNVIDRLDDIKDKLKGLQETTEEGFKRNDDAHDHQDKAHQEQNKKLDNIEDNSEETKQGIHALQEQVGALSGQLGNALEMLYSINNFAYNAKNGYTTYADKEVAAVLNEQKRYGGVVVNIEFKIGEESYCEQKDPNASLNIKDVEFMKLLAIALTEERRLNRNGNIDIVKTFLERVKGMLGTVNRDLGDKDIKEALQEYVETLKKGDNTDDVEYDENLVGKLSKKYKIAIDNAEKDEDGNISLVVSRGDAANVKGWTFCDNNDIKSIKFSRGITQIDEDAITNCQALKSVSFPASIREISEGAISSCDALERLIVESGNRRYRSVNDCIIDIKAHELVLGCKSSVIPDDGSVLSIRAFAFSGYNGLDIKIPACIETIQDFAFYNCDGTITCDVALQPEGWGKEWQSGKAKVKWKEIPKPQTALAVLSTTLPQNMVEASPQKAKENEDKRPQNFALAKDLTKKYGINIIAAEEDESGKYKITISGKAKEIPAEKFKGIEEISHVTIEEGVTSIGEEAFFACKGLASIVLPDSVTNIGDWAFSGCSGLTSITIPDSVTSIGSSAFRGCTGLTSITIPDSVTSVGSWAFYGCSSLTSITIPDSVTSIGNYAFSGCSGLTSITIPDSVTSIGNGAFSDCSGLTSITIPNSVTSIGYLAFSRCSGLTSMTIPFVGEKADGSGATPFGHIFGASSYATNSDYVPESLKEVIITGGSSIGDRAFCNCDGLTSITILDGVTSIGEYAFYGCSGLTSVTFPDSVTSIGSNAFRGCTGLTSVTIPDSVTSIGHGAFSGCSGLTSVTISDSVTSIGYFAFYGCSDLTSITIPDSVTSIGLSAFDGCIGLTSITIPDSVTSIGGSAFHNCSGLTSLTIPDSVTSIGSGAFSGCSGLTSVTIPDSVTSIGYSAFDGCSGLTRINFQGTKAQWQAIKKSGYLSVTSGDFTICCTDGTISKADA